MEKFTEKVATDYGVVDMLVNNAGIGLSGSFLQTTTEGWKKVLDANPWGVIHGCRLFGGQMAEHDRAVARGLLPGRRELVTAIPRCFRRSYHPSQEGSLRKAVDYLATSPAARAAAGAVGRSALS
jgi:NAD(P)-dependent dehydrogenase (short-subunit alcohol dehydrogenase family)